MNISTLPLRLTAIVTIAFSNCIFSSFLAEAYTFSETTLDQDKIIAVARPYGGGKYDLLVIEQIPGKRSCWKEKEENPVVVDPLLINFDFTGICRRSTDSNGYSIRLDGNDLGLDYLLRIVNRGGELQLVGSPRNSNYSEIVLGSTQGLTSGFMKINLYSGWQFTKRTYKDKVLGHFYLSGSQTAIAQRQSTSVSSDFSTASIVNTNSQHNLTDISGNKYENEISKAVNIGLMSGFKDNTFRPDQPINRGQLLSMAVNVVNTISSENFKSSHQDINKIKQAYSNFFNIRNTNNALQESKSINRAELIDVMQRVVMHLKKELNISGNIQSINQPIPFSDVSYNSTESTIKQIPGYCSTTNTLSEKEVASNLESKATRDYTASILVKVLNCLKSEIEQAKK